VRIRENGTFVLYSSMIVFAVVFRAWPDAVQWHGGSCLLLPLL
jgi:hypothetical protein